MFSWESAKHFFVAHSSAPESTWLDVRLKKWQCDHRLVDDEIKNLLGVMAFNGIFYRVKNGICCITNQLDNDIY
jgi:hypothetical protein